MVEFKDDGYQISVSIDGYPSGHMFRFGDCDGKPAWLIQLIDNPIDANDLKQIAEYMMKLNESEAP